MRRGRRTVCLAAVAVMVAACRPGLPDTGFGDGGTVVIEGAAGAVSAASARGGEVVVVHDAGELTRPSIPSSAPPASPTSAS